MSEHTPLTEAEVEVVLEPCECGHTLNDHGDLGGCWMCNDEGDRECWVRCEDMMLDRIARILAARTSTATADTGLRERVEGIVRVCEQAAASPRYEASADWLRAIAGDLRDALATPASTEDRAEYDRATLLDDLRNAMDDDQ